MPAKIANIAKNTSYFTFALILQKIISFAYFTLIARALGPDDLGKYYFAISFTTIFAIFIDLGLANVLTREVAKIKKETSDGNGKDWAVGRAQKILNTVLTIKVPLALISFLCAAFLINILGYPEITKKLVYISSISMILDSFTLTFFAVMRGFHNLSFESVSSVAFQLIAASLGLTVIKLGLGLNWLIGTLAAASLFNFLYSAGLILFRWKIKIKPLFNYEIVRALFVVAIPFALYAVFQRVYSYLDTVLLSYFAGDRYVGLYQVAFKIILALQFLPMAFTASLYPAFAEYWKNNRGQLPITFERAMNYLIIISLPISLGIIFLADKIVLIFKSDFGGSILPLRITMVALLFIFLNFPIGSLLNACDRQKINTANMGVVLLTSVILNIILIPFFQTNYNNGAVGAALTVLLASILMFILGIYQVPKITAYRKAHVFKLFAKTFLSAAAMALFVFYFKNDLNILITIISAGAIYAILIFILGAVKKEDVVSIAGAFRR